MSKAIRKQIADVMHQVYHEVAADLPPVGQFHWAAAVDIMSDWAYDKLNSKLDLSKIKLRPIAQKVAKEYCSNDTALSNARLKAAEKRATKKPKQPKQPRVKRWDDFPPKRNRLGISSY